MLFQIWRYGGIEIGYGDRQYADGTFSFYGQFK